MGVLVFMKLRRRREAHKNAFVSDMDRSSEEFVIMPDEKKRAQFIDEESVRANVANERDEPEILQL